MFGGWRVWLLGALCISAARCPLSANASFFENTTLTFSPATVLEPLTISLTFTNLFDITSDDEITITLPRFTRRTLTNDYSGTSYDLDKGSVILSPSTRFVGAWVEGEHLYSNTTPFRNSELRLYTRFNQTVYASTNTTLKIYPSNGIGAYCGSPSSSVYYNLSTRDPILAFTIRSNTTNSTHTINKYDGIGTGCAHLSDCNGHGLCDYCSQTCACDDGYGSSSDLVSIGKDMDGSCSQRVCPAGRAVRIVPSTATLAHDVYTECSGAGVCNRDTGLCRCFPPFTGSACERTSCPNNCSGHGQCMSMRDIAKTYGALTPAYFYEYGTALEENAGAWDFDTVFGCVCDSSWKVGYGDGDTQLPEYFGPDCSQRHCPSGDNPFTPYIETECTRKTQDGAPGRHRGLEGNLCHVDCSNRGLCDYSTGKCNCFEGSTGDACDLIKNKGTREVKYE